MGSTRVDSILVRWTTVDFTAVRTAVVRRRTRHRTTVTMPGTPARWCAAPDPPYRTAAPAAGALRM
ncbi:hypothetical protein [Streptomyces sp. NPDC086838]|uniref:hypothetical protein n=1 Tax=Streptomyces sp. NPDC086838 TaxID=3365762 RepID=UPI001046638F